MVKENYKIEALDAMKWVIVDIVTNGKYGPYESRHKAELDLELMLKEGTICSRAYDM